ncbi:putative DNA primase/helicase [Streptomyces candidus]|uniref:Putative DNA primase/helicase n=2 Tax=Streptomyces candidus TaxID=67283 RepID=A0A7X0LU92_9ACTN|nr:phage/plasmid primase, P4 family [Streptomyces candidus]MBB6440204.1 putative DNA primase/helicase [Streptomyces candidus]GHH57783.1 DNA primase/helicase [Streptomyces candidus]
MSESPPLPGFDASGAAQQMHQLGIDVATQPVVPAQHSATAVAAPAAVLPDALTDRGNAKLFARLYRDRFRYVVGMGWHIWDEYRWRGAGGDNAAVWAAGDMAEEIATSDPAGRFSDRELAVHRRGSASSAGMKAMLFQAQAAPSLNLDPNSLDGDAYALCTPAGVVNLRSGELRKPDPLVDMHSRATAVAPQPMPIPRWHTFLRDTFGDDEKGLETIRFLHLLLGYSITGDVGAQVLPFLYGSGANGKSVLLEVLTGLLGDYADAAPPGFLMEKGKFSEHSTELTELHGRRIIVCSELKPNDKFDESRVKLLTGGDRIKARRMRQDFFSFTPTHKLWLLGNHRPEVGTGGHAFWRRMRLIPFERSVPNERKIDNLADELVRNEGPGILAWLIEGSQRYLATRDPLTGPTSVRVATAAYETTEDHIGRFLKECCTRTGADGRPNPDLRVEQKLLYETYGKWCAGEDIRPSTARAFASRIRQELGLSSPAEMIKSNVLKLYPGLALLASEGDAP